MSSKYYERFMTIASGNETPVTIPVQKKKTNWRDWQAQAIRRIGNEDFFRINAPTGSGKSRLLSYLGLKKVANGKSVLVVVPQNNIASAWADTVDFKIGKKTYGWKPKDLSKSIQTIKEELMVLLNTPIPQIVVCCYPSFVNLINYLKRSRKLSLLRDLFLIVDEAHHLAQQEDGFNGLGQALDIALPYLRAGGGGCALSTATPYRGDRLPYLSKENVEKYFPDTSSNLYHLSLAQFFSSKDCKVNNLHYNFYLFGGSYFDAVRRAKKAGNHTIIYLPKDGHYTRIGSKKQDYEQVRKIVPHCLNLLNYPGNDQKLNIDIIANEPNYPAQAVVTQNLMQEGFNWNPCDSIIAIGHSTSITQTVQRIGRMLRNYDGKTEVTYCHLLPYTFDNKNEEKARVAFNEYIKVINASMIVAEILQPVFLPKSRRDARQKPTAKNRKRFAALERIFGDVSEIADFMDVVVKRTLSNTDSKTTKQEIQQVLKNYIKQELQKRDKPFTPSIVKDVFLEIYITMARAQKLLPPGLTVQDIDIWLLSDDKDPFTIFSTTNANTFDKISFLISERRNWTIEDLQNHAKKTQW